MNYAINVFRKGVNEDLKLAYNETHDMDAIEGVYRIYEDITNEDLEELAESLAEDISDEFDNNVEEALAETLNNAITYCMKDTDIIADNIQTSSMIDMDVAFNRQRLSERLIKQLRPTFKFDIVYSDGITRLIYVSEDNIVKGRIIVTSVAE